MDAVNTYTNVIVPILIFGSLAVIIWGCIHACIIYFRTKDTWSEKDRRKGLLLGVISTIFAIFIFITPIFPVWMLLFLASYIYLFALFLPRILGKHRSFKIYVLAVITLFVTVVVWGVVGYQESLHYFDGFPSNISTAPPVPVSDRVSQ